MQTKKWIHLTIGLMAALVLSACGGGGGSSSTVKSNAGDDQTVHVGTRVHLDGRKSVTESNWMYRFRWHFVSKPSGSGATLSSTTSTGPSFTPDKAGRYVVELNVTVDNIGSKTDQVIITATNTAPTARGIDLVLDVNQSNVGVNWRSASSAVDADGDSLSVTLSSDGTYGTCALVGDQLTYLKTAETKEVDHCTLNVTDGYATTEIPVTVTALYWTKLSSKINFTLALKSDGTLWGWGANLYGQLGDDTTIDRDHPVQEATHATDWVDVAAGEHHSLAIRLDGSLYAWGRNTYGQVGDGTNDDRHRPNLIDSSHSYLKVSAGNRFSLALRSDHTLWSWGENYMGKTLGIGAGGHHNEPVQVGGAAVTNDWADMSAGDLHTLAIKTDGTLWAWGIQYGDDGRLGDGSGSSQNAPVQIGTDNDWSSISAAAYDSFAIKNNGDLYAWGYNGSGRLGVGDYSTHVIPTQVGSALWQQISAGTNHTVGIQTDGTLWGWGANSHAQRGDSDIHNKNEPIKIGSESNWIGVVASRSTTIAVNIKGILYGWGYNKYGQLGNGQTDAQYTPMAIQTSYRWKKISIGTSHALAIRYDGTLWGWGYNGLGQLGNNMTGMSYASVPVQENHHFNDWIDVSAGNSFSVALRNDNTLWTWGSNLDGRLGLGQDYATLNYKKIPTQVGTAHWIKIGAGERHAAAIRKDSFKLYMWGDNQFGQLGVGDNADRNTPTQDASGLSYESVSCGRYYTMAIKKATDATLYGWGQNNYGQLGINNTSNQNVPKIVSDGWQSVAAGANHTIGIKTNDTLWGWGRNHVGQLGSNYPNSRSIPTLLAAGSWGMVAAGGDTSMAIKTDDTVWVWGSNEGSQHAKDFREIPFASTPQEIESLSGTQASVFTDLSVSSDMIALVKQDSSLFVWGTNDKKMLTRDWYTKEPTRLIGRH